jgi:hypothetical protein
MCQELDEIAQTANTGRCNQKLQLQSIAGTFPKHFAQKRGDKETIIQVYDRMLPLS